MHTNLILGSNRGKLECLELPISKINEHEVLIETAYSAVSVGTETTI